MYNIYGYLLRDHCEILCDTCTYETVRGWLDDEDDREHVARNAPRTWKAAMALERRTSEEPRISRVRDSLTDRHLVQSRVRRPDDNRYSTYWRNFTPERMAAYDAALAWHDALVHPLFEDGSESPDGESCGACHEELTEPWGECVACGADGTPSMRDWWASWNDGDGEGYHCVCKACADAWREQIAQAGRPISDDTWQEIMRATSEQGTWNPDTHEYTPHALSLVTEDGRWAPGRVVYALRQQDPVRAAQGSLLA